MEKVIVIEDYFLLETIAREKRELDEILLEINALKEISLATNALLQQQGNTLRTISEEVSSTSIDVKKASSQIESVSHSNKISNIVSGAFLGMVCSIPISFFTGGSFPLVLGGSVLVGGWLGKKI